MRQDLVQTLGLTFDPPSIYMCWLTAGLVCAYTASFYCTNITFDAMEKPSKFTKLATGMYLSNRKQPNSAGVSILILFFRVPQSVNA